MAKILYVLSGNISHTPRALKSINTLIAQNNIKVIGINRGYPWVSLDYTLIKSLNVVYNSIPLSRQSGLFNWVVSKYLEIICKFLFKIKISSIVSIGFASNRASIFLYKALNKEREKFDLVICHSSGALFPTWYFAMKQHIPFISDIEDYYPGEQTISDSSNEKYRREFLLKKLLPDATAITIASPLIGEQIKKLVGETNIKNLVLINNCFPSNEFEYHDKVFSLSSNLQIKLSSNHIVHFVWFSQNIAANRGLELIIPALAKINDKVHLHLIGNLYDDFNRDLIAPNQDFITTYPPLPQKELNHFICQFDIGLALEPGKDENNLVAVSNKIWAYLQAGLYILATNTPAQIGFMKEHAGHGTVFEVVTTPKHEDTNEGNSLLTAIKYIVANIEEIRNAKQERFTEAKKFAWEKEQGKLLQVWDKIIG